MTRRQPVFRRELAYLRESLLSAVRDRNEQVVDDNLEIYRELVEAFVGKLEQYGTRYNRELARREQGLFSSYGWVEIEWIQRDFAEILREAFLYPHQGILFAVLYFPISIAGIALEKGDYFTFSRLVEDFPDFAYTLALRVEDAELKSAVIDRIARYLQEFSDYHVASRIEHISDARELESIGEIAEGLVLISNRLLKRAFEKRRIDDFKLFMMRMNGLFRRYSDTLPGYGDWLALTNAAGPTPVAVPEAVELYQALRSLLEHLRTLQDVARFGLTAWIAQSYVADKLNTDKFAIWFGVSGSFGDLPQLLGTYLEARRVETQDLLRWSWWVTEGAVDQVVSINFDRYLDRIFVLYGLQAAHAGDPEPTVLRSPKNRELKYLASGDSSPLVSMLGEVVHDAGKWVAVVRQDIRQASTNLRAFLDALVGREEQLWRDFVVNAPLDPERVAKFKADILDAYENGSEIQDFLIDAGYSERLSDEGSKRKEWGINLLLPKDVFVPGSNVMVEGFGSSYGGELALSIGEQVLKQITGALPLRGAAEPGEAVINLLCATVGELRKRGLRPVIALLRSWETYTSLFGNRRFKASPPNVAGTKRSTLVGLLDDAPVHTLHYRRSSPQAVVADFRAVGTLKQYEPRPVENDEEVLGERLLFMLRSVTETTARQLIGERPGEFLLKQGNEDAETVEEAVLRLQERVHFRLFEASEYVIADPAAGFRIPLRES